MTFSQKQFNDSGEPELLTAPSNKTTKRIFIAATRMNDGKTTTSLALFSAVRSFTERVGFIKPVGQRFIEVEGHKIDEDSVLLNEIFHVDTPVEAMSPIAVYSNFTREYLDSPDENHSKIIDKICRAFDRVAFQQDYIIIEGSGHAGVGSIFGLSNADIAKYLNAKVIIVTSGGIGGPVDEIALNKAVFEAADIPIIGAIINKVQPEKIEMVQKYCSIALKRMNVPLLGCIAHEKTLTQPNLQQIVNAIGGRWLHAKENGKYHRIHRVVIGAMSENSLAQAIGWGSLIIAPLDCEEIVLSVTATEALKKNRSPAGIILTHEIQLESESMNQIRQTSIPVILCPEDSYSIASKVNKMTIKTQPKDTDKISIIKDLICKNIDLNVILQAFESQN